MAERDPRELDPDSADARDPRELDPDYDKHGGFPRLRVIDEPPGFGRFVSAMRRAQDLAVSADVLDWNAAAERVEDLVAYLAPHEETRSAAPAGRVATLPGAGSVLMPPWQIREFTPDAVEVGVQFSSYHVGGNNAVHGGVVAMMFDVMCGIIIHSIGRPISRTAFLHVDYRNITPIDVPLTMRGWASKVEGRKTFVNAELTDPDGTLTAEANGLMVQLLPGQP
ncbi:PaaI family thioesterase [Mycolicibacterium sp.]|uniref:PaaI family thioesterase n=1 Tax=Mycolicibacterium sp. TaxID=2320850 RepID=UPI0025E4D680|nr:PaaI family thioesterase [Mycolicibacterium sp.]